MSDSVFIIHGRIWRDKSIKTQHERGMINLPNELS